MRAPAAELILYIYFYTFVITLLQVQFYLTSLIADACSIHHLAIIVSIYEMQITKNMYAFVD
ncbi:hypothetical protein VspSTUT11_41980 [Vibrio sp. STUT-A11]|nr:hypothetical protein VspSTUT11_41980 [Vibrio sp. STUT-A11]